MISYIHIIAGYLSPASVQKLFNHTKDRSLNTKTNQPLEIQKTNLRIHAAQVEDVVCCGRGRLWPCPPQRRQFRGSQCAEVANAPVPCFHGDVKKWINFESLVLL